MEKSSSNKFYCGKKSSFISCISHVGNILTVRFKKDPSTCYHYLFVPKKVFNQLKNADSVGKELNESVKGRYLMKKATKDERTPR
jgi:hypothetical protein